MLKCSNIFLVFIYIICIFASSLQILVRHQDISVKTFAIALKKSVEAVRVTEADNSQVLLIVDSVVVLLSQFSITMMQKNCSLPLCVFRWHTSDVSYMRRNKLGCHIYYFICFYLFCLSIVLYCITWWFVCIHSWPHAQRAACPWFLKYFFNIYIYIVPVLSKSLKF